MSESSTLTRCPHCQTRFRVTEEQLRIARGKVRCGHCLQVFNASDHQESSTDAHAPTPATSDPLPEEDFIFEDNPEEDAAAGNYAGQKNGFPDDELSDSFRAIDDRSGKGPGENTGPHDEGSIDESWAEAMLTNDQSNARLSGNSQSSAQLLTNRQSHDDPTYGNAPGDDARRTKAASHSNAELSQPEAPTPPLQDKPARVDQPASRDNAASHALFFTNDSANEASGSAHNPSSAGEAPVMGEGVGMAEGPRISDSGKASARSPYDDLRVEPVTAHYTDDSNSSNGLARIVWGVALVALIALLIAQVTYFQADRLSSIPELRPYYEQGCDLIGCELRPLVAVDRIDSERLVVRTHPEQRNTLIVDAVIVNRAEFAQPFPNIALTFSNLNEDVMAQSLFEPGEYIAGEAEKLDSMPSDTPIRISINIRDPGRDAVNYNIAFVAPQ